MYKYATPPASPEKKKRKVPPTAEEDYAKHKAQKQDKYAKPMPMEAHSAAKRAINKWDAQDAVVLQQNRAISRLLATEAHLQRDASGN